MTTPDPERALTDRAFACLTRFLAGARIYTSFQAFQLSIGSNNRASKGDRDQESAFDAPHQPGGSPI